MAELIVDLKKLRHNIQYIQAVCHKKQLELIGIVKGCYTLLEVIQTFQETKIPKLGFSRVSVGQAMYSHLWNRPSLITMTGQKDLKHVPQYFSSSFHSELSTIRSLMEVTDSRFPHGVILMVDNGDLREGVMPDDVLPIVEQILSHQNSNIQLQGIGANLGCCSGTIPDEQNLNLLSELAESVENRYGIDLETVSIGGSVALDWIEARILPSKINQVRVGEAILLGNIPTIEKKHPQLFDDVFCFRGEVVEIKTKPGQPTGQQGVDALGRKRVFKSQGPRKRAILNFGVLDTDPQGLTAYLPGIELIAGNSDYTILDVTDCPETIQVSDVLDFKVDYSALIHACFSPLVSARVLN